MKEKVISKRTKIILGIVTLALVAICIYQSYAIFKESRKLRFIWGVVEDFEQTPDIIINVFVDGEKESKFPINNGIYHYEKLTCTNSGNAEFSEETWQMAIKNVTDPTECDIHFISITKLKDSILYRNKLKVGTPDFSQVSTDNDTGLWSYPEYNGTSYYFRGTKELLNNNVIFAGFKWKVVRINTDGSIRLIYNGTTTNGETSIGVSNYNDVQGNNKFIGYMYGESSANYTNTHQNTYNSTIKEKVDNWYLQNILNKDSGKWHNKIADNIFCNDREMMSESNPDGNTGLGYGTNLTYYMGYNRVTQKTPNLSCTKLNDSFNVSSSKGNNALTYPIGLITIDEVILAGGVISIDNSGYYLHTGQRFWTMTPHWSSGNVLIYLVNGDGRMTSNNVHFGPYGVRPVISLKSNVEITSGNGSEQTPYIVK